METRDAPAEAVAEAARTCAAGRVGVAVLAGVTGVGRRRRHFSGVWGGRQARLAARLSFLHCSMVLRSLSSVLCQRTPSRNSILPPAPAEVLRVLLHPGLHRGALHHDDAGARVPHRSLHLERTPRTFITSGAQSHTRLN